MQNNKKVYVVTGASSGIGLEVAKIIYNQGHIVYCFARSEPDDKNIKFAFCDVSDRNAVKSAFELVIKNEGRIDCVINNAGIGISGPAELEPFSDVDKIININFTGAITVATMSLPYLRETKGTLINISSAGSEFPLPFQAFYTATKSGLQGFSGALRNEMRPLGVKVICALPGDVKTPFTKHRLKYENDNSVYGERARRSLATMEKDEQNGMSVSKVANAIYKLSNKKNPPTNVVIGFKYKVFKFIKRFIPDRMLFYILYLIYGK